MKRDLNWILTYLFSRISLDITLQQSNNDGVESRMGDFFGSGRHTTMFNINGKVSTEMEFRPRRNKCSVIRPENQLEI